MEENSVLNEKKEVTNKQTKKQLFYEILRFLLVGGLATLVDFVISYLLEGILPKWSLGSWSISGAVAASVGFTISLFLNYFLSVIFVYKHKKDENEGKSIRDFWVFVLISVIVLAFQLLFIFLVNDIVFVKLLSWDTLIISSFNLTWGYAIAKIIATLIGLVVNYIGRKIFIFK